MSSNIFNSNSERLNCYNFINLSEVVALKMAKRIAGKGIHFNTENRYIKEALEKLEKDNDLMEIIFQGEKLLSAYGYLIPTWDRSKGGKLFMNIGNVYGNSQVSKIEYNEELAVVWMNIGTDNTGKWLRTTYTKTKVVREIYTDAESTMVSGASDKILKENQLPKEEVHNLGFVPVSFFQNLPKKNMYGGTFQNWYPDSTPVKNVQKLLDFLYEIIKKEAEFNRTRAFVDITSTEMNSMLHNISQSLGDEDNNISYGSKLKSLIGDFIIATDLKPIEGAGGKAIEIIQGDPQFSQYVSLFDALINYYFAGCGLSTNDDIKGSKTNLEVRATSQEEDLTITTKKTIRQHQWKHHFDKALMYLGIPEEQLSEYSIEFKDTSMKDSIQELENEQFKIENGLSSRIMSIMKIEGINREQAIAKLDQIKKDNELYPPDEFVEEIVNEADEETSNEDKPADNEKPNDEKVDKTFLDHIKAFFNPKSKKKVGSDE